MIPGCLLPLNAPPPHPPTSSPLQDKYLQGRSQRIRKLLREAAQVADIMAASYSGAAAPLPADLAKVCDGVCDGLGGGGGVGGRDVVGEE